jgi:hypothetical protein
MYNSEDNSWTELHPKQDDKRVWHQGVHIDSELIIVGGVKTNISAAREPVVSPSVWLLLHTFAN